MKKLKALLLASICTLVLAGCGAEAENTEYEQYKLENAQFMAEQQIVPMLVQYASEEAIGQFDEYTAEEVEYILSNYMGISSNGYAFKRALESFESGIEDIGGVVRTDGSTAKIDDDQIIVDVDVVGNDGNAVAEIILSNDMFYNMESAALNPKESMGSLMGRAALNTLLGMGTVFVVLIIIILVISLFSLIPKLQAAFSKEKKSDIEGSVDKAVAQIEKAEEQELAGDTELVAVIAAAIAAYEGAASTDGFVVRSVRRSNRARR